MLTELKRCNSIGNINGVLFLISIMVGKNKVSKEEIRNRCDLESNVVVNSLGAIAFFQYLRLVKTTSDTVIPLDELNAMANKDNDKIINRLVMKTIHRLVEDGIFDDNVMLFDTNKGRLAIKKHTFPLDYAAIRNFLIMVGALDKNKNGLIGISKNFEINWVEELRDRRKKITLVQFIKRQEDQNKRGLKAEEFVLALEKSRLPGMAQKIKRISDFDVSAGYDIVSYEDHNSQHYDRFIEVKCYIGSPHFFWSKNESDIAKLKSDQYFLCLVDYTRIEETNYQPDFIQNPYDTIFNSGEWSINSASYRIQKIQ